MSDHTASPSKDHAGAHDTHSIRGYMTVYFALLVGTALTVWASFIHFGSHEVNIAVALLIASVKAFLVGGYFMHLISEKKMIYSVLIFTAIFFVGLMFLTLWSFADFPPKTVTH
jgi:cytochrome c oxidase subunit IV